MYRLIKVRVELTGHFTPIGHTGLVPLITFSMSNCWCVQADFFYIPARTRLEFVLAAAVLAQSNVHSQSVMAALLGIVTDEDGRVTLAKVLAHGFLHRQ